jgi:orotate phosphoribosyltransferase
MIGAGMLHWITTHRADALPDAIGGMAIGADPITASVVVHAGQRGLGMRGFMVRKEAKTHGTGKLVEGPVTPGMTCIIVEDVITSGGSALKAAQAAEEFGMKVLGILGVIDRLEGGREAIEQAGWPLATLLTINDFR